MKVNMPVTQNEVRMVEGQTLVSKTDLKGAITYVNPDFITISGFSEQELIGNNHNMVRHPDMPSAAFQDLWDSVKQGRPWTGMVKNRCKNGDFYWVLANVIPITKNGQVVEYMSVRSIPTDEMVRNATALYKDMNAGSYTGKSPTEALKDGYGNLSIKKKLMAICCLIALIFVFGAFEGFKDLGRIDNGWHSYQEGAIQRAELLQEMKSQLGFGGAIHNFKNYVLRGSEKYVGRTQDNIRELSTAVEKYRALTDVTEVELSALRNIQSVANAYKTNLRKIQPLVQQGQSAKQIDAVVKINDRPAIEGFETLVAAQATQSEQMSSAISTEVSSSKMTVVVERVISLVVLIVMIFMFVGRTILKPLEALGACFKNINEGYFENDINILRTDEIGTFMQGVHVTQVKMRFELEDSARLANEATRIKNALDVCQTNVMVADNELNIIYMNDSVQEMFKNTEADLKQDLPNFNAAQLLGSNIDIFHKNPAHQRHILEGLKDAYSATIVVGGRTFNLVATPVFDDSNARLGVAVEWNDQTEELVRIAAEREISDSNARMKQALDTVSANVMVADASRNIIYMNQAVTDTLTNAESDLRKDLSNFSVQNLIGNSIDVFHKNPEHQKRMLENLTDEMTANIIVGGRHMTLVVNPINNDENERIGTVVEWTDRTNEVSIEQEIDRLVEASANGDLSKRIDPIGKTGFFEKLALGLNQTVESTDSFLRDMGVVLSAMSEGNLTKTINKDYKGSFGDLKLDVNKTINKLTDIITQIRDSSGLVHSAANEIYQGNDDLSRRTEAQASSLEETAASMEEITSTVKESSTNASEANHMSSSAKQKAAHGGQVVKGAIVAMGEILDSSNKINDIIGVIDEIAFQTNLLALNAAVEAARAGEQGRGFAVVAGEVRTLSQRSAAAAKEIKDLIRDSVTKVESGSQLVNQSGDTLGEIVTAIDDVAGRVEGIANSAAEQQAGIGQINQAITQMDDMTQQNAALVEEASAASEALSEQAGVLNKLVGFFSVGSRLASPSPMHTTTQAPARSAPAPSPQIGSQQSKAQNKAPSQETVIKYSANKGSDDSEWEDF